MLLSAQPFGDIFEFGFDCLIVGGQSLNPQSLGETTREKLRLGQKIARKGAVLKGAETPPERQIMIKRFLAPTGVPHFKLPLIFVGFAARKARRLIFEDEISVAKLKYANIHRFACWWFEQRLM